MSKRFFITGTDTDAGKTVVTCGLAKYLRSKGATCAPLKPVAAGASQPTEHIPYAHNQDAIGLIEACATELDYQSVNPVLLTEPASPHISAKIDGVQVNVTQTVQMSQKALNSGADYVLIEGAGGWFVPINDEETVADLACAYGGEVILVVGLRLGCLNHALLSAEAIFNSGLSLKGWVGVSLSPDMPFESENIQTLEANIAAPMLAHIGFNQHKKPETVDWKL